MPTSYLTPEPLHPGAVFHGGHGGGLGFARRLTVLPPGGAKVGKQGNFRGALRANLRVIGACHTWFGPGPNVVLGV